MLALKAKRSGFFRAFGGDIGCLRYECDISVKREGKGRKKERERHTQRERESPSFPLPQSGDVETEEPKKKKKRRWTPRDPARMYLVLASGEEQQPGAKTLTARPPFFTLNSEKGTPLPSSHSLNLSDTPIFPRTPRPRKKITPLSLSTILNLPPLPPPFVSSNRRNKPFAFFASNH